MATFIDSKTPKVAGLIVREFGDDIKNILVVGCGDGVEAAVLAQSLGADVTGIDLKGEFDADAQQVADLRVGDAMALDFADETFDLVYSYHALEHIDDPVAALREMHRVLKPNGGLWIGTPNRSRLVGYIGGRNTSFINKIQWNLLDWRMRLAGRFRNEYGAHAGFSSAELGKLLGQVFSQVDEMTYDYFSAIYARYAFGIKFINASPLSGVIFPSVYFAGRK